MQRHDRGGVAIAALLPRIRVAGALLLGVYLGLVAWLTLRPVSVPWVAPTNLTPLATIRAGMADGSPHALSGLGSSLALLAPLGVLLPLAAGRLRNALPGTWARTVSGGALISAGFVLVRSAVPGHQVNVDSVVLNTTGIALVALLLFPLVRALLLRWAASQGRTGSGGGGGVAVGERGGGLRRRKESGQDAPPRAARVGIAP